MDKDPVLWWTQTHKSTRFFCFVLKQRLKTYMLCHSAGASSNEWTLSTSSCLPGARGKPHPSPAQPLGWPGSVYSGGPWWISGRPAPHYAGGRPAQAAQHRELLWGRAAIQAGATDGSSQHGDDGRRGMNGGREERGGANHNLEYEMSSSFWHVLKHTIVNRSSLEQRY